MSLSLFGDLHILSRGSAPVNLVAGWVQETAKREDEIAHDLIIAAKMSDSDLDSHEKVFAGCYAVINGQEIDTLKALRASLESIKQVIQGVHDDLVVSQNNYKEITRISFYLSKTEYRTTGEMDWSSRPGGPNKKTSIT